MKKYIEQKISAVNSIIVEFEDKRRQYEILKKNGELATFDEDQLRRYQRDLKILKKLLIAAELYEVYESACQTEIDSRMRDDVSGSDDEDCIYEGIISNGDWIDRALESAAQDDRLAGIIERMEKSR